MQKFKKVIITALFALAIALPSFATTASESDAMAMLKKAATQYTTIGADKAKAEFNKPDGEYVIGDLYIYCVSNADHKISVHPVNKALIGVDFNNLKDADGFEFGKAIMSASEVGKINTVDYKWANPATKSIGVKRAYFQNLGTDTCVVGIYKN